MLHWISGFYYQVFFWEACYGRGISLSKNLTSSQSKFCLQLRYHLRSKQKQARFSWKFPLKGSTNAFFRKLLSQFLSTLVLVRTFLRILLTTDTLYSEITSRLRILELRSWSRMSSTSKMRIPFHQSKCQLIQICITWQWERSQSMIHRRMELFAWKTSFWNVSRNILLQNPKLSIVS